MIRMLIAFMLLAFCGLADAEVLIVTSPAEILVPSDVNSPTSCSSLFTPWPTPSQSGGLYIQSGSSWQQSITPMSQPDPDSVPVDFTGHTLTMQFAPSAPIGPYDSMDMVPVTGDYAATPTGLYVCWSSDDTLSGTTCTSAVTGDYTATQRYSCFYGGIQSDTFCTLAATVDIASGVLNLSIPADQTLWMSGWQGSLYIAVDGVDTLIIPVEFHPTVTRQF
jgi:hypothetical protein